jgi:CspA family cold shock protein
VPSGPIKWFNEDRGYGFIKPDNGRDVFIHVKEVQNAGKAPSLPRSNSVSSNEKAGGHRKFACEVRSSAKVIARRR